VRSVRSGLRFQQSRRRSLSLSTALSSLAKSVRISFDPPVDRILPLRLCKAHRRRCRMRWLFFAVRILRGPVWRTARLQRLVLANRPYVSYAV